jgi:threo-3-hydroxy-L-aspartate ammonia-lyase
VSNLELVTLEAIREAAARIRPLARVTPLIDVPDAHGDAAPPRALALKCENLQRSGAFKIRGAANMLLQLPESDRARGVITFSSGNHGIAMALAARVLGVPAVVVMPTTAPAVKVEGVRTLGAEVIFEGTTTLQRKARTEAEAAARGLTIVPPFDHEWIVAGQGTIGLEILEQAPEVSAVYVPCSGGGLLAGVSTAIKRLAPQVRVIGVEPAGAPRMSRSLAAGSPVTLDHVSGIADGLLAVRPGDITFRHIQAHVDEIVAVGDDAIADAVRWVFEHARLVSEPSGAATVAAVLTRAPAAWSRDGLTTSRQAGGSIVALISGGNVNAAAFGQFISQPRPA